MWKKFYELLNRRLGQWSENPDDKFDIFPTTEEISLSNCHCKAYETFGEMGVEVCASCQKLSNGREHG